MYEAIERVRAMLREGLSFDVIEEEIEKMVDLDGEGKAALWLLAWAEQDDRTKTRVVRETLAFAGT